MKTQAISDDALYYHLGRIKLSGNKRTQRLYGLDTPESRTRDGVIKYAKKALVPFLPDEQNLIPRSQWDVESAIGVNEKNLMWTHFWTFINWARENHTRSHDYLICFECTNRKPYGISPVPALMYGARYSRYLDMCAVNNGPIPYELSHHYPVRFDEWRHNLESPSIRYKYMMITGHRFLRYVKKLGYKKVFVCMQHPDTQIIFDKLYEQNINNCREWLFIISDQHMRDEYYTAIPQMKNERGIPWGVSIQRFMVTNWTQQYIHQYLDRHNVGNDSPEWQALNEAMSIEDPKERQRLLKRIERKAKVSRPFDMLAPAPEQTSILDPSDFIDPALVDKFKQWLRTRLPQITHQPLPTAHPRTNAFKNDLYAQRFIFGALDMLLDYYEAGELGSYGSRFFTDCPDCDIEYWNMVKAIEEVIGDDLCWLRIPNSNSWYYTPVAFRFGQNQADMLNLSDTLMLTSNYMTLDWLLEHSA